MAQSTGGEVQANAASTGFDALPRIVSADTRRGRGSKHFKAINMHAGQMAAYASFDGLQPPPVIDMPMTDGIAALTPTKGTGGYYWLSASEERDNRVLNIASITYFSNPGPAPREMLTTQKSELTITPVSLPREHNHFRSGDREQFQVGYQNGPVANAEIWFMTSGGTEMLLKSDDNGFVTIPFPDDFPAPGAANQHANHGQLSNEFVLMTHLNAHSKILISAFNYHYQPGPFRDKSRALALGLLIASLLLAVPIFRRRTKNAQKKG
ncbi:MAG: DUF4198 domain-containing protein [Proteobacteria bacterium]|nr:DUF4198 domain-containing protein [Pseudomonadota bacterium]